MLAAAPSAASRSVHRGRYAALVSFLLLTVCAVQAYGQDTNKSVDGAPWTTPVETIAEAQTRIDALSEASQQEDDAVKQLMALYTTTKTKLESVRDYEERSQELLDAMQSAPAELDKLSQELESLTDPANEDIVRPEQADKTRATIEHDLSEAQARVTALQTRIADMSLKSDELDAEPAKTRIELADAKDNLTTLMRKLDNDASNADPFAVARHSVVLAGLKAGPAEIEMLNNKILSHDARQSLLSKQQELAVVELEQAQTQATKLAQTLSRLRVSEARQAAAQAAQTARDSRGKHPVVVEVAEKNGAISRELANAITAQRGVANTQREYAQQAEDISAQFAAAKRRLEIAGLSSVLGEVLRDQRRKLPKSRDYREQIRERVIETSDVGLKQFTAEDDALALKDLNAVVTRTLERSQAFASDAERDTVRAQLETLFAEQRDLLNELAASYGDWLDGLADVDFQLTNMLDQSDAYTAFLDERLLWIPSAPFVGWETLNQVWQSVQWFLTPGNWIAALTAILRETVTAPVLTGSIFVAILLLFRCHLSLTRELTAIAQRVASVYSDSFSLTAKALFITVVLSLSWPLVVAFVGWHLRTAPGATTFVKALGTGLGAAAVPFFYLRLVRYVYRSNGLAEAHFRWTQQTLKLLRRHLWWLSFIVIPMTFITAMAAWPEDQRHHMDGAGRVAFMIGAIAISLFAQRVLNPSGDFVSRLFATRRGGWLSRLRYVWYPTVVGIPLVLAIVAGVGYMYTAEQLMQRIYYSLLLIVAVIFLHALTTRWLVVAQRKLAWKKAQSLRLDDEHARAENSAEGARVNLDTAEVDIATIKAQTRHLLMTIASWSLIVGLWFVWANLLPALGVLDTVTVWQYAVTVDGQDTLQPITLSDIAFAVVVGAIVVAAARNLPGVLEIAVLQRLPLEPGSRYAITTVSQYIIVAIGLSAILGAIGMGWSRVQWLIAALGVGLGFGLQEIFANFVSGLILLFERPVRIGDTVTVDNQSGTVSRIRIRATTIVDWDNKEIIIPNKTFITGHLINWTLTETVTRVVIPIGIAYGSDTKHAYNVILGEGRTNPLVLSEPEPSLFFLGFGDSSLNFELRVYVRTLGDRLPVTHELHMAIERALNENGIEMPFPQRDLHIRSVESDTVSSKDSIDRALRIVDVPKAPEPDPAG